MTTISRTATIVVAAVTTLLCSSVVSFAPLTTLQTVISSHSRSEVWSTIPLCASSTDSTTTTEFPPLSETKIRQLLDTVPVYAVVEPAKEALVLLAEQDNPNSLAYLSFSPQQINDIYAPLRAQQSKDTKWEVTAFPLGLAWYELLQNPHPQEQGVDKQKYVVNGIEYRLLADPQQLAEARNMVKQASVFQQEYNEIPVFVEDFLRVQDSDGNPLVPLCLSLNDLLETCQRANEGNDKYQASVNLSDLVTIIGQMQQTSSTNFEQAILVPPSAREPTTAEEGSTTATATAPESTTMENEAFEIPGIPKEADLSNFEMPVTNQWDD